METTSKLRGRASILAALFTVALAFVPRLAHACPTCFAASGEGALRGYWWSTTLLSLMPLVLIAVVALAAWMLRNRRTSA